MGALKGMFSFFTMIRLDITKEDMDAMDRRFWLVPVIGAFYGLIAAFLMTALMQFANISALASSVLTFFIIFAMNRFLHIDGTIDVGDGLVVAGTREDHLRALKDTRIGAGGMAFALMVILMSITFTASIWNGVIIAALMFTAEVSAKVGMVSAAAFGEPGDGMAGNSVRNTSARSLLYAVLLAAVLITVFAVMIHLISVNTALPVALPHHFVIFAIAAIIVSVITGGIMSAVAKKNFGMVNGDVLGATNELTRAAVLLTFLVIISVI